MFGRRWRAMVLPALLGAALAAAPASPAHADTRVVVGPRVVGGVVAEPLELPWMVHLSVGCGGTVVAPRVVLTAAHCLGGTGPTDDVVATIGRVRLSASGGEAIRSTFTFRNPGYDATGTGDWGLVELAHPTTAPSVPIANADDTSLHQGVLDVAGWGATREGGPRSDVLHRASVPFVSDGTCLRTYRDFAPRTEMCAGGGQVDACQGDSGGPLLKHVTEQRWVQLGIVSYGHGCGRPGYPGVYTEVQAFAREIDTLIGPDGALAR